MKVLVTGAQGFVGRYLIARLLGDPSTEAVRGVGRSPDSRATFTHDVAWGSTRVRAPLPRDVAGSLADPRYRYESLDLSDVARFEALLREFEPDAVINMASGLRDDAARHLYETNVLGAIALLETIARAAPGVRLIVLGSSGGVYGNAGPDGTPIAEDARCEPADLYCASKLASEHATRIVADRLDLPVVWTRMFNLVGPGQDERHVAGRFAAQACAIARGLSPPRMVVGNLASTRDFVDIRDVADAVALIAARGQAGEAYNVASGVETSVRDVLDASLRAAGIVDTVSFETLPPRPHDIPRHVADIGRLRRMGFTPSRDIRTSVGEVVSYYLEDVATAAG